MYHTTDSTTTPITTTTTTTTTTNNNHNTDYYCHYFVTIIVMKRELFVCLVQWLNGVRGRGSSCLITTLRNGNCDKVADTSFEDVTSLKHLRTALTNQEKAETKLNS
jgi:hypothetical protein